MRIGDKIKVPRGSREGEGAFIRDIKGSNIWLCLESDPGSQAVKFDISDFGSADIIDHFDVKNPFKEGDYVVVTNKYSDYRDRTGYVCKVGTEIVSVALSDCKTEFHFTNIDFANKEAKLDNTRNESVWCIFKANGEPPKKLHTSYEQAKAEMDRLAKASSGHKFYLLEAIEELQYEMKYERKELKYNQYPQE